MSMPSNQGVAKKFAIEREAKYGIGVSVASQQDGDNKAVECARYLCTKELDMFGGRRSAESAN